MNSVANSLGNLWSLLGCEGCKVGWRAREEGRDGNGGVCVRASVCVCVEDCLHTRIYEKYMYITH
jgi:hypothetical protein